MTKEFTEIKLSGIREDNSPARIGSEVYCFSSDQAKVGLKNDVMTLVTRKGSYDMTPHMSIANLWTTRANGVVVHFSKKKLVASLRYWA